MRDVEVETVVTARFLRAVFLEMVEEEETGGGGWREVEAVGLVWDGGLILWAGAGLAGDPPPSFCKDLPTFSSWI